MTDEQREHLEEYLTVRPSEGVVAAGGMSWAQLHAAVAAALADLDGLAPLADLVADNADWEAYGRAREREECLRLVEGVKRDLETQAATVSPTAYHPVYLGMADAAARVAAALRARGPLAPPLPAERLAARVAALGAALKPILARVREVHPGVNPVVPRDLLEAARKALEDSP
jgi:hypothetical protein